VYDIKGWDPQYEECEEIKSMINSGDSSIGKSSKSIKFHRTCHLNVWTSTLEDYYSIMSSPKNRVNIKMNDLLIRKVDNVYSELYISHQYNTKLRMDFIYNYLNIKNKDCIKKR